MSSPEQKWREATTKVNAVNAFNHYGKLHSLQANSSSENVLPTTRCFPITSAPKTPEQTGSHRRKTIIGLLCLLLVAVICVAIVVPITLNKSDKSAKSRSVPEMVTTLCKTTLYPQVCEESLLSQDASDPPVTDSKDLVLKSVKVAHFRVTDMEQTATNLTSTETDVDVLAALTDCQELLNDAVELLDRTMSQMSSLNLGSTPELLEDLVTWMSAALTDPNTCIDGFDDLPDSTAKSVMLKLGNSVIGVLSNALSLVNSLTTLGDDLSKWKNLLHDRGLLESNEDGGFPEWMGTNTRRHLSSDPYQVDVIVARDGSGKYKDIQTAIDAAPEKSEKLYVIYIKKGVYSGQFVVPKKKTNLMFKGDGIGQTFLTGSYNVQMEGITTFMSATLIIQGAGFIGKDFTVKNTAGAQKHQAVAMRVSADRVAFWRCSFEAYQDTLYTHSLRQFYKECNVEGTVDFVFGNGAALFQSCNLRARVPMQGQQNTITAQGRTDPSQNTGLVFHNCSLDGTRDLQRTFSMYPTYMGRPWKLYSRTVFIRSYLGKVMHLQGWLIWSGDWALNTCYYAEYQNRGPGSKVNQRVGWSKQIRSASEVTKYSISQFLGGQYWLPKTKVPYESTVYY